MGQAIRPGDVLAGRYRLVDLLTEAGGGRFWRARDQVLERTVALHVLDAEDPRAPILLAAARSSATVQSVRLLRVLDAEITGGVCYVVNEWGSGTSLDVLVAAGPLGPRRAAWLVAEVADSLAAAHASDVPHGRLVPENVLIDHHGEVRIIGHGVDAALHGLPMDRPSNDILDLAGLLYCALTTRWGGTSNSVVESAPLEHQQILRPRRVRAGIPRPLDVLCDEVLHPHLEGRRDLGEVTTAAGIRDYLLEFVGDPSGLPAALLASCPNQREPEQVVLPDVPEFPVLPATAASPEPDPEPGPASVDEERPTEAGMPIFGEGDDDVEWFQARSSRPTPPPAFEAPASRPLFAPKPVGGGPVRRPRPQGDSIVTPAPAAAPPGSRGYGLDGDTSTDGTPVPKGFWPWETMGGGRQVDSQTDHPVVPVVPGTPDEKDEVPGRNWVRLGIGVLALLVLAVAILVAITITRGPGSSTTADPNATEAAAQSANPTENAPRLRGLSAVDLDPQANPPQENPGLAPLAVDGDRSTVWQTERYSDQLGPGGLKTGVGLVLDLGGTTAVEDVRVFLKGTPTDVSLYLTDEEPGAVADLEPVASDTATKQGLVLQLEAGPVGRYLTVWLTSLPADGGGFRGRVAEVVVRGNPS